MGQPDIMMVCPYNRSHVILRTRMPKHLVKCKKNYRGEPLETCPFNAMHLMKAEEMQAHLEQCQDHEINYQPN